MLHALILIALLFLPASPQTYQAGQGQRPVFGPMRSSYIPSGPGDKLISIADLDSTFVKSVSVSGGTLTLIVQNALNQQQTINFTPPTGGGGGLTNAQAQAIVGQMFTTNSETGGISLTYNSGTEKIDVISALPDSVTLLRGLIGTNRSLIASNLGAIDDSTAAVRDALGDSMGTLNPLLTNITLGLTGNNQLKLTQATREGPTATRTFPGLWVQTSVLSDSLLRERRLRADSTAIVRGALRDTTTVLRGALTDTASAIRRDFPTVGGGGISAARLADSTRAVRGSLADTSTTLRALIELAKMDERIIRHIGEGAPATPPTRSTVAAIDNNGKIYPVKLTVTTHTQNPQITTTTIPNGGLDNFYRGYNGSTNTSLNLNQPGQWVYNSHTSQIIQRHGSAIGSVSWAEMVAYIHSILNGAFDYRQTDFLSGSYGSDAEIAADLATHGTLLSRYQTGQPAITDYNAVYAFNESTGSLTRINTFTAGTTSLDITAAAYGPALVDETRLGNATSDLATQAALRDTAAAIRTNIASGGVTAATLTDTSKILRGVIADTSAQVRGALIDTAAALRTHVASGAVTAATLGDSTAAARAVAFRGTGHGHPSADPLIDRSLYVDIDGNVYPIKTQGSTFTAHPTIVSRLLFPSPGVFEEHFKGNIADPFNLTSLPLQGDFALNTTTLRFVQNIDGSNFAFVVWVELIDYLPNSSNYADATLLPGTFHNNTEAANALSRNPSIVNTYENETLTERNSAYFVHSTQNAFYRVISYSAGTTTITVDPSYGSALVDQEHLTSSHRSIAENLADSTAAVRAALAAAGGGVTTYNALTNKPILQLPSLPGNFTRNEYGNRYQLTATGEQYIVERHITHGLGRAVDYSRHPVESTYLGETEIYAQLPAVVQIGFWYFVRETRGFYEGYQVQGSTAYWRYSNVWPRAADTWLGYFPDLATALSNVTANEEVFVAGTGSGAHVYEVSSFTAGSDPDTTYYAMPTDHEIDDVEPWAKVELPDLIPLAKQDSVYKIVAGQRGQPVQLDSIDYVANRMGWDGNWFVRPTKTLELGHNATITYTDQTGLFFTGSVPGASPPLRTFRIRGAFQNDDAVPDPIARGDFIYDQLEQQFRYYDGDWLRYHYDFIRILGIFSGRSQADGHVTGNDQYAVFPNASNKLTIYKTSGYTAPTTGDYIYGTEAVAAPPRAEVLLDTSGISFTPGIDNWNNDPKMTFSRNLNENDDFKTLWISLSWIDSVNTTTMYPKNISKPILAKDFREAGAVATNTGTNHAFYLYIRRIGQNRMHDWAESMMVFGRGRTAAGQDQLWVHVGGLTAGILAKMHAQVTLVQ